jgi:hypothetical protein
MPRPSAVPVRLNTAERKILTKRARGQKTPHRDRVRARIVLAANLSRSNAEIARDLGVCQDTVRDWRGRYAERGLEALTDRPRSGRPRTITVLQRAATNLISRQAKHQPHHHAAGTAESPSTRRHLELRWIFGNYYRDPLVESAARLLAGAGFEDVDQGKGGDSA